MTNTALDIRRTRGLELAATKRITKRGGLYVVPSATHAGSYIVETNGPMRRARARTSRAVISPASTPSLSRSRASGRKCQTARSRLWKRLRITYMREWRSYNLAQTTEKARVAELLRELCALVPQPPHVNGRPSLPLSDQVFCAVMRIHGTMSGRRSTVDMKEWQVKGFIDKAPHYNSIFRYLESPALTPILRALIERSAAPLAAIESDLAADSSGFATSVYNRWYDEKYGKQRSACEWAKAHVMCGVKTHVVTSAIITPKEQNDSPMLPPLLADTVRRFDVREVSADKGYLAQGNVDAIARVGAEPYIPFKSNSTGGGHAGRTSELWRRRFHLFSAHRTEFNAHYHKRSSVETAFHMIKSKFGGRVRSKTFTAQTNEVLAKILCHNLCVLVQMAYELGLNPAFGAEPVDASEPALAAGL